MVAKTKTKTTQKKRKVEVGKLVLNKESVKDLTGSERKRIKGGIIDPITHVGRRMAERRSLVL